MTVRKPEFSDEQLLAICDIANVVACECPAHLVWLLREVRKFRYYTTGCIERFPEDEETHRWLGKRILEVEEMLSQLLFEFMEREALLDEQQQLDLDKLVERSHAAVLRVL